MQKNQSENSDIRLAAVCGLFCESCSWYIGTTEDPERLEKLADQLKIPEEKAQCLGCRSDKRIPYCEKCTMYACATKKGIDFCSECEEYPCDDLEQFQSAMPHRIELWDNLDRIKSAGYARWLKEVRKQYACPQCQTINSAYDLKCRKCGEDPSCAYVAKHKPVIEQFVKNR